MPSDTRLRGWGFALIGGAFSVGLSIVALDLPVATFAHRHLLRIGLFQLLPSMADPLPPLALAYLAGGGVAALKGWRPGRIGRLLLAAALAVLLALAISQILKYAFGRAWPENWFNINPGPHDGPFGFLPFSGAANRRSFPSGHAMVSSAAAASLWAPAGNPFRILLGLTVGLVAIGVVASDYHFLADALAGIYLGITCAIGATALLAVTRATRP